MKGRFVTLVLAVTTLTGCGRTVFPTVTVEERGAISTFAGPIRITHVIRLEGDAAKLGSIRKVLTTERELFVTDKTSHEVFKFDRTGKFLRSYGFSDVPETTRHQLLDFAIGADALTLLTDRALIRRSISTGAVLNVRRIEGTGLRLASNAYVTCVFALPGILNCYRPDLSPQFGRDSVGSEYKGLNYLSFSPLALSGSRVVLADLYAPRLLSVDLDSKLEPAKIEFPGSTWDERAFKALWPTKGRPTEAQENAITRAVRRFEKVFPLPDRRLLLVEMRSSPPVREIVVFDPSRNTSLRFEPGIAWLDAKTARINVFDLLIGTTPNGFVGVIRNVDYARALATFEPTTEALCTLGQACIFFVEFPSL